MKKLETSQIIEDVLSNGVITEREVLLLKKKGERFQFVGFYNNGNRWRDYYIPIYSLCGMEYYVNSEGIQIIG